MPGRKSEQPPRSHGNRLSTPLPENFRSFVSHQLRAPLTCVDGALRLIASDAVKLTDAQQQELLSVASKSTQRLVELVDQLLDKQTWKKLEQSDLKSKKKAKGDEAAEEYASVHWQPLRVLMVEDDSEYFSFIRHGLEQCRQPRLSIERVADVSSLAGLSQTPDVILLDLTLPDSQGLDTVHAVRSIWSMVPIVVLTGLDDEEMGLQALAAGADDYQIKHHVGNDSLIRCIKYAVTRKKFEESTMRLSAISDFAATLAHDLTTPLAGARIVLQALGNGGLGPLTTEQEEVVRTLASSNEKQLALISRLLEVYQFDLMPDEINFAPVDLTQIVSQALSEVQKVERPGFVIGNGLPKRIPPLQGNANALTKLFVNLIDNAFSHGDTTRGITISGDLSEKLVCIDIHNWGKPIPKEVLTNSFERFWQGVPGMTYVPKSGFGLYLARRIAAMHGGRIMCSSDEKHGTKVSVVLPLRA